MQSNLQNTFKQSDRDEHLIDFRQKNVWMHSSIDCPENKTIGDRANNVVLVVAFIITALMLTYAAIQYPKAYPTQVTVITENK